MSCYINKYDYIFADKVKETEEEIPIKYSWIKKQDDLFIKGWKYEEEFINGIDLQKQLFQSVQNGLYNLTGIHGSITENINKEIKDLYCLRKETNKKNKKIVP